MARYELFIPQQVTNKLLVDTNLAEDELDKVLNEVDAMGLTDIEDYKTVLGQRGVKLVGEKVYGYKLHTAEMEEVI